MQHDEVIWQVIGHVHCSFRAKTEKQNFCRNKNNVTGLCNRSSCPLANSRYATIIEEKGICYLMMKTIERAHTPAKMWEKVKLSKQYSKALEQLDSHLEFWPKFLVHKNKQRLTKITQYLIRVRKLAKEARPKLITMPARLEKREARREAKAEVAARLDKSIEQELLARLQSGTYNDIYNFPSRQYQKVLSGEEQEEEEDEEGEDADEEEELEEEEDADEQARGNVRAWVEFVEGYEDLEEQDDDLEDGWDEDGAGGWEEGDEEGEGDEGPTASGSDDEESDEGAKPAGGKGAKGVAGKGKGAPAAAAGGKKGAAAAAAGRAENVKGGAAAKKRPRRQVEIEYEVEREVSRARH